MHFCSNMKLKWCLHKHDLPGCLHKHDLPGCLHKHDLPGYLNKHDLPGCLHKHDLPGCLHKHDLPGTKCSTSCKTNVGTTLCILNALFCVQGSSNDTENSIAIVTSPAGRPGA